MKFIVVILILILVLAPQANAMDFTAPSAPDSVETPIPEETESFAEGLWMIVQSALRKVMPTVSETVTLCASLMVIVVFLSIVRSIPGSTGSVVELTGVIAIAVTLLKPAALLIRIGTQTIQELSHYGKLLLPVMTSALAAQGASITSAALYTGTAMFDALLSSIISSVIIPLIYLFLCLSVAGNAFATPLLDKMKSFLKWIMTWCLKLVLYVFSAYIGITGVINGSADAVAIKATKLAISGAVPVIGNILSDASETILISAGIMKNAAGVYGLWVLIAIWINPFFEIGIQYLLLKITGGICDIFGVNRCVKLIHDFSGAMGIILAATGVVCLLLMISVVCFMKGVK